MENNSIINKIKSEIIAILINDGGKFTFANIIAEVAVKQLKTGNPYKDSVITKLTEYPVMVNGNYTNLVRNKRRKQAIANGLSVEEAETFANAFVASENWFTKENDLFNGAIIHKTSNPAEKYILFACNPNNKAKTFEYYIDGKVATAAEVETIKSFIPKVKEGAKQELADPVIVRTVKIAGIRKIATNNVVMEF